MKHVVSLGQAGMQDQQFVPFLHHFAPFQLVLAPTCAVSFFPTCQVQVTVVRFYVSWPASSSSFLRRTSTASSPPQAPDQSVPRRTSTVSSGSECSSTTKNFRNIPDRMPERMSEYMPDTYARKKNVIRYGICDALKCHSGDYSK